MTTLAHLEPTSVWTAFEELNAVPRPSKREDQVQAFAVAVGESSGAAHRQGCRRERPHHQARESRDGERPHRGHSSPPGYGLPAE